MKIINKKSEKFLSDYINVASPTGFESSGQKLWLDYIKPYIDDYIVDTYGETETFYNLSNIVFMGGSIIKHGGQNPLEAARYGCKIIHGPNIENF